MKKVLLALSCFFFCLLCSCSQLTQNNSSSQIVSETEYYQILKVSSGFQYKVFDKNRNIIEQGTATRPPQITVLDNSLLKFSLQTGTGLSTQWGFYYNINTNQKSQKFICVYDEYNNKVAYGLQKKIVIQNIFDTREYQEISDFVEPLSDIAEPIIGAEFIDGGKKLVVHYYTKDELETAQTFSVQ